MLFLIEADYVEIRALLLSSLPVARQLYWLPDVLLSGASIAGKAEMLVTRRIGTDWTAIEAGSAPVIYAQGIPAMAKALMHSAAVHYAAAFCCLRLKQIIAVSEKNELDSTTMDLAWDVVEGQLVVQAQEALALLLEQDTYIPAMTLATRCPGPTDPASLGGLNSGFGPVLVETPGLDAEFGGA